MDDTRASNEGEGTTVSQDIREEVVEVITVDPETGAVTIVEERAAAATAEERAANDGEPGRTSDAAGEEQAAQSGGREGQTVGADVVDVVTRKSRRTTRRGVRV